MPAVLLLVALRRRCVALLLATHLTLGEQSGVVIYGLALVSNAARVLTWGRGFA